MNFSRFDLFQVIYGQLGGREVSLTKFRVSKKWLRLCYILKHWFSEYTHLANFKNLYVPVHSCVTITKIVIDTRFC